MRASLLTASSLASRSRFRRYDRWIRTNRRGSSWDSRLTGVDGDVVVLRLHVVHAVEGTKASRPGG
jgi:hypothetical protein